MGGFQRGFGDRSAGLLVGTEGGEGEAAVAVHVGVGQGVVAVGVSRADGGGV